MENKKCPKCGSADILNGDLSASMGLVFIPEGENKVVKKSSYISCSACRDCGLVFDFILKDEPCRLTNRENKDGKK